MTTFKRGDLVQLKYEYEVLGNASLFRIRNISRGVAVLGQLSADSKRYCGLDTTVEITDPDLIPPYPEVLAMYPNHSGK